MQHVVLFGSPCGGFKIHGPFESREAADDWAEDLGEGGEFVMPLHPPQPINGPGPFALYPWDKPNPPQLLRVGGRCRVAAERETDLPLYAGLAPVPNGSMGDVLDLGDHTARVAFDKYGALNVAIAALEFEASEGVWLRYV